MLYLQLGAEVHCAVLRVADVQRAHTNRIASSHEELLLRVVQNEGEVAIKHVEEVCPMLFILI